MGNYELLKAAINDVIKANGRQEITGEVLNQVLLSMVNSLGVGYQCMGVATPSTNPGTPDQNVFYFATQAGTYTNFDAIVLQAGISVLIWDGDWASQTWFTVDATPTNNSQNLIASGAVFNALKLDGGAYDVTAHNSGATFASLSALLNSENLNTLIPTEIRHGGMSIKFVQSSDNKYIQYRLMAKDWSTNTGDWYNDSSLIKTKDNANFLFALTDKNRKLSEATDNNGNKYFFGEVIFKDGKKDTDKVNTESGKSLINEDFADSVRYDENNKIAINSTDTNGKTHHAVDLYGQHLFFAGIQVPNVKNFTGKTILFLGDSITDTTNVPETKYPNYVCQKLFARQSNYAVASSGFSMNAASSHPTWGKNNTSVYKMIERAYNDGITPELIIVSAGTNDWDFGTTKGTFSDINEPSMELGQSFYWHVNKAITNLISMYPTVPYLFITPLPRNSTTYRPGYTGTVTQHTERDNGTLTDFANIIKELCDYYSIPVLEMMNSSNMHLENSAAKNLYTLDGLHPTKYYAENILSNIVINKVKSLIF